MCSAGVVGQDDDDWRTVDIVEQERQTLACSSPLGAAVLVRAVTQNNGHDSVQGRSRSPLTQHQTTLYNNVCCQTRRVPLYK